MFRHDSVCHYVAAQRILCLQLVSHLCMSAVHTPSDIKISEEVFYRPAGEITNENSRAQDEDHAGSKFHVLRTRKRLKKIYIVT